MRYFLAVESNTKPFILWASVANSLKEYEERGFDENPLVIPESELPEPVYGVCPLKIVSGQLVERTPSEMATFNTEWNIAQGLKEESTRINTVNSSFFTYDGNNFPMDEVSRLFYMTIPQVSGDKKIRTMANTAYALVDANRAAFFAAYIEKLLLVTKHTI